MSKIEKKVVTREVALKEVVSFVKKYNPKDFKRGKLDAAKVEEEYLDTIEAVEDGLLVFNDKSVPTYTLEEELFPDAKDEALKIKVVNFRSRIKEADKALVMDGLDIKNQTGTFTLKTMSYISQLSMTEVKSLGKEDYNVINQICSVF